MSEGRCLFPM